MIRQLDEVDVAILDAIHLNPRVSFEAVGTAVGVSATTVARRWQRLAASGQAWVTSVPGPRLPVAAAVLEARCEPTAAVSVAQRLAAIPQAFSVNITSGRNAISALIAASDHDYLTRLLVDVLPSEDMSFAGSYPILRRFGRPQWRLGALGSAEEAALTPTRAHDLARPLLTNNDRLIYLALQADGRRSYRDLAGVVDLSEGTVRRRIDRLTQHGLLAFRADFARSEGGWPLRVALKLHVPDREIEHIGHRLAQRPEVRLCLEILDGASNLFVTLLLHQLQSLSHIVSDVHRDYPSVTVTDRQLVLRSVKSWGHLLDSAGRSHNVVPVDLWEGEHPANSEPARERVSSHREPRVIGRLAGEADHTASSVGSGR